MEKRPLLICTDPGIDDFVALCMLMAQSEFEICGIVCLSGNVGLDITVNNALVCKELMKREDIPILVGSRKPLCRPERNACNIHGKSGLGNSVELYSSLCAETENGADFIARMAEKYAGRLELLSLGPLTDIAIAMEKHPACKTQFRSVTLMGGGIAFGNASKYAEFNILADPEAADRVFSSGVPVTMVGLDVTHKCVFPRKSIPPIPENASTLGTILPKMLHDYCDSYRSVHRIEGTVIHDAVAALVLVRPQWYTLRQYDVKILLTEDEHLGQTAVQGENCGSCYAAVDVEQDKVLAFLEEFLQNIVQ